MTGEASVEVADYFEAGIAEYRYFIIEPEAKKNNSSNTNKKPKKIRTEIFFKGKPHEKFQTGKKLKVRGKKRANGRDIDFESLEELEPEPGTKSEPASRTMSAAAPKAEAPVATPETRKILTILMDFTDALVDNGGSNGVSLQEAKDIMFNNPRNVSHFYDLASLGTLTIPADPNSTGGDAVYGPYLINDTYVTGTCDYDAWRLAALTAFENDTGQSRYDYRHHQLVMPNYYDYDPGCTWAGYANVGCGTTCWAFLLDPLSILHGVMVHELGHNFTFGHASTDPNNDGVIDVEYGDLSDMMGSSRNWMNFNPPHFEYTDWYDPISYQLQSIAPTSTLQTFHLIPVDEEDTDWPGLRAVKTPRATSRPVTTSHTDKTPVITTTSPPAIQQAPACTGVTTAAVPPICSISSACWNLAKFSLTLRLAWSSGESARRPLMTALAIRPTSSRSRSATTPATRRCPPASLVARGAFPDTIELSWKDVPTARMVSQSNILLTAPPGAAWQWRPP